MTECTFAGCTKPRHHWLEPVIHNPDMILARRLQRIVLQEQARQLQRPLIDDAWEE